MRENRLSGSEGGATLIASSLPLSISLSLRDRALTAQSFFNLAPLPLQSIRKSLPTSTREIIFVGQIAVVGQIFQCHVRNPI